MPSTYGNYPSNGNLRLYVVAEVVSQEENNNRSRVRFQSYMTRTASNGYRYWNLNNTSGWIDYAVNSSTARSNRTMSGYDFNMGVGSKFYLGSTWSEVWVNHNSDGTKTAPFKAYHNGSNTSVGSVTTSTLNYTLPTLYQGISVNGWSIDNITTNSVRLNVSSNRTANLLQWSINNGAWQSASKTFTSTTQTISGLTPGTSYTFKVRVRRASNGVYSSSSSTLTRTTNTITLTAVNNTAVDDVGFTYNITSGYTCDRLEYTINGGSWNVVSGDFTNKNFTIGGNLPSGEEHTLQFRGRHKDSGTYTPIVTRTITTQSQNNFLILT